MSRRARLASVLLCLALPFFGCGAEPGVSSDPLLDGDFVIEGTQQLIELLPAVPWLQPGADGRLGSPDDVVVPGVVGDVDLVVRAGTHGAGAIPPTGPLLPAGPIGVEASLLSGAGVAFTVWATDGASPPAPVISPALEGNPVLVVAFADLDGDGFVGITSLDGVENDDEVEELELDPVGRRFASFSGGIATGSLAISVGGEAGDPVAVILTAAAYTGALDPGYFQGLVPDGPAVMAGFPFLPDTDPARVVSLGGPAGPDVLVGVDIDAEFTPEPTEPSGEIYTLTTDGSMPSIDVIAAQSGAARRLVLLAPVSLLTPTRAIPVATQNGRALMDQPREFAHAAADGPLALTLHAVDALGNATALAAPELVTLRAGGGLRLLAPDADGDPSVETLMVSGAALPSGLLVSIDTSGAAPVAHLEVESAGGLSWSRVTRIDGDVDGDGVSDLSDNCVGIANPDQTDGDASADDDSRLPGVQRYGDACDADLDGDGRVAPADFFGFLRPCLGQAGIGGCAASDLDGDGVVAPADFFDAFRPAFGQLAGPGTTDAP